MHYCVVVPEMDACHMLLACGGNFDNRTAHDGYCSTSTRRKKMVSKPLLNYLQSNISN